MIKTFLRISYSALRSSSFFYFVVLLLFIQASWFALTSQFPMAFDENYHFGIIQFYSHQLSPFMTSQPAGSEAYGDIVRYDSYMFHYLMSFPYRIISLFISDQVTQIILLRFINIAMFIAGLFAFRNLLHQINISKALTNFALFMLTLIPIVPFLAATINYDNLSFIVVPVFISLAIYCAQSMKRKTLQASRLVFLVATGIFGSLVKFAFAPIFLITLLYLLVVWIRSHKKRAIFKSLRQSFVSKHIFVQFTLVFIAIISIGLFAERYGVNIVQYKRFQPSCENVRPISECIQYGPWGRDYATAQSVKQSPPPYDPDIALFLPVWIGNYMSRLYFAINYNYSNSPPLPLPYYTAYVVGIFGLLLCLIFWRTILKTHPATLLVVLIIAMYVASLYYVNFTAFLKLHTIVAANGRYLILVMPLIFALIGIAYQKLFSKIYKKQYNYSLTVIAAIVTLLTLNGGGALTHLVRMNSDAYWQNSSAPTVNATLKNIVTPFIIGGK